MSSLEEQSILSSLGTHREQSDAVEIRIMFLNWIFRRCCLKDFMATCVQAGLLLLILLLVLFSVILAIDDAYYLANIADNSDR